MNGKENEDQSKEGETGQPHISQLHKPTSNSSHPCPYMYIICCIDFHLISKKKKKIPYMQLISNLTTLERGIGIPSQSFPLAGHRSSYGVTTRSRSMWLTTTRISGRIFLLVKVYIGFRFTSTQMVLFIMIVYTPRVSKPSISTNVGVVWNKMQFMVI